MHDLSFILYFYLDFSFLHLRSFVFISSLDFLFSVSIKIKDIDDGVTRLGDKPVVDKAARGGETVLKHLENKGNTCFHMYFSSFL